MTDLRRPRVPPPPATATLAGDERAAGFSGVGGALFFDAAADNAAWPYGDARAAFLAAMDEAAFDVDAAAGASARGVYLAALAGSRSAGPADADDVDDDDAADVVEPLFRTALFCASSWAMRDTVGGRIDAEGSLVVERPKLPPRGALAPRPTLVPRPSLRPLSRSMVPLCGLPNWSIYLGSSSLPCGHQPTELARFAKGDLQLLCSRFGAKCGAPQRRPLWWRCHCSACPSSRSASRSTRAR